MAGDAKKAAPRDKDLPYQEGTFIVTGSPHFINGSIAPVGAEVQLMVGVEPGAKLIGKDAAGKAAVEAAQKKREARKAAADKAAAKSSE